MEIENGLETRLLGLQDERWLNFIRAHPGATIFHHPAWIDLLSECYGYRAHMLAAIDPQEQICAGWPFMEVRSVVTGNRWVSLPFSDYCNPLCGPDGSLESLTDWFIDGFRAQRTPRIELRWELPSLPAVQQDSGFVRHTIPLSEDIERVKKGFKRTHWQNVRTAEERGARVEFGNRIADLRMFYRIHLETRRRHGVPVQPWRFFERIAARLFEPGLGFVLLAYKEDECIAGIVVFYWQKYMIAKYAASKEDSRNLRPNNLLFWKGIQWGCEHGMTLFDFGRTEADNEGLRRYKKGWGAVEQPLNYSILSRTEMPTHNGRLFGLLKSVFQKSPLWISRMTGEFLYRHYG